MACARVRCEFLQRHLMLILTVSSILLGFILGFGIREAHPSSDALMWIGLPGEIFLRVLKMLIVPIVVTNIIAGTASLDPRSNGLISVVALGYIALTNTLGSIIGVILAVTIRPGDRVLLNATDAQLEGGPVNAMETQDIFADLVRNIFPDNLMSATFRQVVTQRVNNTQTGNLERTLVPSDNSNILGLIFASVAFGIATSAAKEKGKPFLQFFRSAADVVIVILRGFLWYAPVGICSLIAASVAGIKDLGVIFASLGFLVLAVLIGLTILQLVVIPVLHFLVARENPFRLLLRIPRAWFITFAASGSAVAMPEMEIALDDHGVDHRVSQFCVPFSVTLSANGSAIFIVNAAIFLAQLAGMSLNGGHIIIVGVLTAVSSMALPSVPSASLVSLLIIMTSLGLPTHQFGLLLTVEWFLDRIRSAANTVSHTYCAAFTYNVCKNRLTEVHDTCINQQDHVMRKMNGVLPNGDVHSGDALLQAEKLEHVVDID